MQQENFDKSKKLDNDQAVDNLLNQADKLLNKPAKQIQAKKEGKATGPIFNTIFSWWYS
nr:hypothetical protein [Mycoplasmopsis bovis]